MHIPPFIEYWDRDSWVNKNESDWGSFVRTYYFPLLVEAGVDVVIGGHSHIYQRGEHMTVDLLVVGGGGGSPLETDHVENYGVYEVTKAVHHYGLFDISDCKLQWRAYDLQDHMFDTFSISRC